VSRFIDAHGGRFGVEPICRVLGVSASAYYRRRTGERSRRVVEDEWLLGEIERVHAATGTATATGAPGLSSSARASGSAATGSNG